MRHIVTLLLLLTAAVTAGAADFFDDAPTGQRLYYNVTSGNTVQLVAPMGGMSWTGYTAPAGRLRIPNTVNHNGTTYSVASVANYAFSGCIGLTSVTLGEYVVSVGSNAFANDTMLTSFYGGGALQRVGMMAFYSCSRLDTIELPETMVEISTAAFIGCGYYNNMSNWGEDLVLTIGRYVIAVSSSDSGDVVIPEGMQGLANGAFYYCHRVDHVTLPATLRFIGSHCFQDCFALDTVRLLGSTPPTLTDDIFFSIDPCTVVVPCSTLVSYQSANIWNGYPLVEDTCTVIPPDPPDPPEPPDTTAITCVYGYGTVFGVSPNPASEIVYISIDADFIADGGTLQILDLTGRMLATHELSTASCQLSTANYPSGTYLLRLVTPQGTGFRRLVVAR